MKAFKHEVPMKQDHGERITRLETTIDNINQTLIRLENKMDQGFKEVNVKIDKINDRLWSNFLWLLSAMFLFSGILCSVMAKGFDWFS